MTRRLSQEARHKALDAAQELVGEEGIEGFTVDGVARRSGVAKTTLYRHWPSGNELLIDAVGLCFDELTVPDLGSIRSEILQLFRVFSERVNDLAHRRLLISLLAAAMADPELQRLKERMLHRRIAPARQIVTRAAARGEIPPIDLDLAVHLIHGPFLSRAVSSPEPITDDEMIDLADLIARGLGT
jgi:AcrR family transcriptional regulator